MRTALLVLTLIPLVALLGTGCVSPGCQPSDNPGLTIGKGATEFSPLDDGGRSVPMIFGSQGGFHIDVALEATGINPARDQELTFIGTVDGREVSESFPFARFTCSAEADALQAWGLRLILFETPSQLNGELLTIDVEFTDRDDALISASAGDIEIDASAFQ